MATVTLTGTNFSPANSKFLVTATGAKTGNWRFVINEIMGYDPTDDEIRQAMRVLLAIGIGNKTPAQAKTWISAGVVVTTTV